MMSYEQWLGRITEAARDIASREFQQEAWFPGGSVVSSPDEVYQSLIEDCTFDLFFQTYGNRFSEEQMRSANNLRSILEQYYARMPKHPDPVQVLNDPEWDSVRQSAATFLRAFDAPLG
jgi:hypothetical protein